jgi:hypothetical protein
MSGCCKLRNEYNIDTNKCIDNNKCSLITGHPQTCFGHLRGHLQGCINNNPVTITNVPELFTIENKHIIEV